MNDEINFIEARNLIPNTLDTSNSASFIDISNDKRYISYLRGIVAGDGINLSLVDSTYPNGLGYSTGKTIHISASPSSSQSTPQAPFWKITNYTTALGTKTNYYTLTDDYTIYCFSGKTEEYLNLPLGKPNGHVFMIKNISSSNMNLNATGGNLYNTDGSLQKDNAFYYWPGQAYWAVSDGNNNWNLL